MTVRQKISTIVKRSVAAILASVFAVVGGAQLLGGWPVWKAAVLAVVAVAAQIAEGISRGLRDGSLTDEEIDEVFDNLEG
jgi:hypothetical protein